MAKNIVKSVNTKGVSFGPMLRYYFKRIFLHLHRSLFVTENKLSADINVCLYRERSYCLRTGQDAWTHQDNQYKGMYMEKIFQYMKSGKGCKDR